MQVARQALWRRFGWSLGAVLLIAAAAVLGLTVDVHAAGGSAACGSAWDVVSGRSGWQQWWALDQADPVAGAPRLRTQECVDAVNARVVGAALLATGAVAAFGAAAVLGARRPDRPVTGSARRLRRLGTAVTVLGVLLTVGGLIGIALLVADPNATLFLYVDRSVVVLLGFLLLLPALVLVALGRGASMLAEYLADGGATDETT